MKQSLTEYLRTRVPPAPDNLLARMQTEIDTLGLAESDVSPKALADAGASILRSLDESGCVNRSAALDLLAADALFTYAFEAAADSVAEIESATKYLLEKVITK